jgi:hypothetical protein
MLINCEKTLQEHRYIIVGHFYYIIDNICYVSSVPVSKESEKELKKHSYVLKDKFKDFVFNLYYDSQEQILKDSKGYINELLSPFGITSIDYKKYDSNVLNDIIKFIKMSNNNDKVIMLSKSTFKTQEGQGQGQGPKCRCYCIPCVCSDDKNNYSYSDSTRVSYGSTQIVISSVNDFSLIKLHNKNKFQEKYENNKEEVDFMNFMFSKLCLQKIHEESIKKLWLSYKISKIKEHNVKIRNKNVHFLYAIKIVTCIPYEDIIKNVYSSSIYIKKINLEMLCDAVTHKIHTSIETSFDNFFNSYESICVKEFKKNHDYNKQAKFSINDSFYSELLDVTGKIIDNDTRVILKNKINIVLTENINVKNNIYFILKSYEIKMTKKDLDSFIKKYY